MPDALLAQDPAVEAVIRSLTTVAKSGADELYAESALTFLAVHLLTRHARLTAHEIPTWATRGSRTCWSSCTTTTSYP